MLTPSQADALLATPRVAIVGVAKNSGKTTTLNALLSLTTRRCGLLSIGIDGEQEDALIGTLKPGIFARRGQLVVTARAALARSSAQVDYIASLGFSTPMGEVFLVEVREPGEVLLAGIRHSADLGLATQLLGAHGAECVLIDGAYGRTIAAHADYSDGFILSTGAILSSSVQEITAHTAALVHALTLAPPALPWHTKLLAAALAQQQCLLGTPAGAQLALPARSALLGLSKARALWRPEHQAIAIPGLVSDRVIEELLAISSPQTPRTLLLPNGTHIKTSPRLFARLRASWDVRARASSALLGLSLNPTHVHGARVDGGALHQALSEALGQVPIFDVRSGLL